MRQPKAARPHNLALCAAATLTVFAAAAHAQSATDSLIHKLEQKGILTADEAQQLRTESGRDFQRTQTNNFGEAFGKFTGAPSWVTGYQFSGDFRGRYDQISVLDNDNSASRTRLRYRLRFGIVATLVGDMEAGFRLGSGDSSGNPLSNNTTFENDGSKKPVWIDTAYGKWTAIRDDDWRLAFTFGKMDNPFQFTPMVFDPDWTPEGVALTGGYAFNRRQKVDFAGAGFVLDELSGSGQDPFMVGGQVLLNSQWTEKWSSSAGVGAFSIINPQQLTTANVPYVNRGNSRTAGGVLIHDYNPVIAAASVTYMFDRAPLYPGRFPIKLAAEFMHNAAISDQNNGYWAGIVIGKSGRKHTWSLSYRYEYLEADAWYDQVVGDDMAAFYQTAPTGGGGPGAYAGTNLKGHQIKFDYSVTDALTVSLTSFITDVINDHAYQNASEPGSGTLHFMADLIWKF